VDQAIQDELITSLRAGDPDRLYMALFTSGQIRSRLLGLFAFNLEVASTRERISEAMLGQIRLQWWRDALDEIRRNEPRRHPVVEALATWMPDAGDATFDLASSLIDAREADLEDAPFETVEQLKAYAEATSSNLIRLTLLALGIKDGPAHEAAVPAGRAYALTGIIRAVPFLGAQGRVMLPASLLAEHGIMDARQSIGRRDPEKLKAVLQKLGSLAADDLAEARHIRGVPRAAKPALQAAALAQLYLNKIERADFDLSDPRMDPGPSARIVTLMKARLFGW
jgi:NADH dehydrogenase [ubiquinone] 1 alpha subcomplex assembly factor 6